MEQFVPVEHAPAAVAGFIAFMASVEHLHDPGVGLFTGVRYVLRDDIPLSQQHGRDNAVLMLIVRGNRTHPADEAEFDRYSRGLEQACKAYGGRPRWGKQNYASAADVEAAYPTTIAPFRALRQRVDPRGTFLNAYLRQRLGIEV